MLLRSSWRRTASRCCFTKRGMKAEGEVRGFSQLQMLMQPKRVCGCIPVVLSIKTGKMHIAFCPVVQLPTRAQRLRVTGLQEPRHCFQLEGRIKLFLRETRGKCLWIFQETHTSCGWFQEPCDYARLPAPCLPWKGKGAFDFRSAKEKIKTERGKKSSFRMLINTVCMSPGAKLLAKLRIDKEHKIRNIVREFPNMGSLKNFVIFAVGTSWHDFLNKSSCSADHSSSIGQDMWFALFSSKVLCQLLQVCVQHHPQGLSTQSCL